MDKNKNHVNNDLNNSIPSAVRRKYDRKNN